MNKLVVFLSIAFAASAHAASTPIAYIYTLSPTSAGISAYGIASNGVWTKVSGSPFAAGSGAGSPYSILTSGSYVFALGTSGQTITTYSKASSGVLKQVYSIDFSYGNTENGSSLLINEAGTILYGQFDYYGSGPEFWVSFKIGTNGELSVLDTYSTTPPTGLRATPGHESDYVVVGP